MPIYEYQCLTCDTVFEKRQSFSEEPVADCPNGHSKTRRLLAAPAIVFKGNGFYINDSRATEKNNSSGKNGHASGSETKSESKSEAKTDGS